MNTTLTPPPVPPLPVPAPPASGSGSAPRVIAIVLAVIGGLILLGAVTSSILSTVAAASVHTSSRSVDATGVTDLDVHASAGSLRVEFADVDEAELEVTGSWGADRWVLERDGSQLILKTQDMFWGTGWWFGGAGDGVLTLPFSVQGADADLTVSAGELFVDGAFGDLRVGVSAGDLRVAGAAETVRVNVSAGDADVTLADVATGEFTVSAGGLTALLTGDQPDTIDADISAGSLRLTVPEGEYFIEGDASAGSFQDQIGSTRGAASTIRVDVSAGTAVLQAR